MAKLETAYVHSLIHSLGKGEKRHFKVYGLKDSSANEQLYFRLFDAIEEQKEYDEEKLRKLNIFSDLPTLKKRLYAAILKSLEDFHSSIGLEIRELMNYIEILFNKSLFSHCERQIEKAKRTVSQNELFEEWLELLKWEYRIAVKRSGERSHILEEEKKIFMLLNNQKKYRDAANLFLAKYQRYGAERSPARLREMKKAICSPLLKDERLALSFNAKQNFYDCHSLYSLIRGDFRSSYGFSKKAMELYAGSPAILHANSFSYLVRVNNFLLACLEIKEFGIMKEYIRQIDEIRQELRSPSERATAFFYLYHRLNYCINTATFEDARAAVQKMELELPEHEENLNHLQKITLYSIIAEVYFGLENYKRCLFWQHKILAMGEIQMRQDLECFIRLFHLIVHYEAKTDQELMGALLRSTYRFLRKHEHLYKFETTIMNFFRKYILTGTPGQNPKQAFIELKSKLEILSKDPYEKQAFNFFDLLSWLESKIEEKSFAEILRKKAQRFSVSG